MEKGGWVYILTNRPRGTLYTGVTANLPQRMETHRAEQGSGQAMDLESRCRAGENDDNLEADPGGRPVPRSSSGCCRQTGAALEGFRHFLALNTDVEIRNLGA